MFEMKTHFEQVPLASIRQTADTEAVRQKRAAETSGQYLKIEEERMPSYGNGDGRENESSQPCMFDVFKTDGGQNVIWRGAAVSMEEAKKLIREWAVNSPGDYLILNHQTGNRFIIKSSNPSAPPSAV
jgi:hypothetical protein